MTNRAAANKRLGDLIHLDGGLYPGMNALLLQRVLQGQGVDDGGQHTHVVGGDTVHLTGLLGHAAKEIPAANNNGDLDAQGLDVGKFSSNFVDAERIDAEALVCGQGLAGEFQQNAFEYRSLTSVGFPVSGCQSLVTGPMPIVHARPSGN